MPSKIKVFWGFVFLGFFLLPEPAWAYTAIKIGVIEPEINISTGYLQELEWGQKNWALSIGHWNTHAKDCGTLHIFPILAHLRYPLTKHFHIGSGGGFALIDTPQHLTAPPRMMGTIEGICFINENWFIEIRYTVGDLDIHNSHSGKGILEEESNLQSFQIMIGWRF